MFSEFRKGNNAWETTRNIITIYSINALKETNLQRLIKNFRKINLSLGSAPWNELSFGEVDLNRAVTVKEWVQKVNSRH